MSLLSRISPLFISALLAAAGTLLPSLASASTLKTWQQNWSINGQPWARGFATPQAACGRDIWTYNITATSAQCSGDNAGKSVSLVTENCPYGDNGSKCNVSCNSPSYMSGGQCVAPVQCSGDSVRNPVTNACELNCEAPKVPNPETNTCDVPSPQCEPGQFHDFDTNSCKWPQDDTCSVIGASWNNTSQSCQCGTGKLLVTAAGVSRCMAGGDDSCSKSSPDFKGYGPSGKPVCDASARCPNGGTPGRVGQGDQETIICIPPVGEGEGDSDCNGTSGIKDGVRVCIPKPGTDPDLPDCKGVVGKVGTQKVCIEPATNDSRCKPGETAGYTGVGAEMKFVCVPKGYGPETCPPGQYIINKDTEGFGCVTASGDNPSDDPTKNAAGKTPGKISGNAKGTTKDADGNTVGTSESTLDINIDGMFHDAPDNNYKSEIDAFGGEALDSAVDIDTVLAGFGGADGAFTQRSSLDNASSFIKTHTVGNNASCSGSLPFLGYEISCAKFENMNRILGWLLFVTTIIWIYNTLMRKSESGV